MAKELKQRMAEELRTELASSPNVVVVGLNPMDAETNVALRSTLRDQGARLRVIHNRTSRFALEEPRQRLAELFTGQTALTLIPGEDPDLVAIARTLVEEERKKKSVEVRGAWVDGELLGRDDVEALSRSPDKETLRGMICGVILGSARGLATVLQAVPAGLARCLQAHIDELEEQGNES